MLGSTFTLALASGSKVLPLINQGTDYTAEYYLRESLVSYRVQVRHSNFTKAGLTYDRHNVTVTRTTFATTTTPEVENTASFTQSMRPGDTYVEVGNALAGWIETSVSVTAATNANLIAIVGWQS